MCLEEMVQDMQKNERVRLAPRGLCLPDIVYDHVADPLAAVLVAQELLGERGRGDLGQVLVLGDREHLFLAAQSDAVVKCDHASLHEGPSRPKFQGPHVLLQSRRSLRVLTWIKGAQGNRAAHARPARHARRCPPPGRCECALAPRSTRSRAAHRG